MTLARGPRRRPTSPCWPRSSTEVVRLVREAARVTGAALGLSPTTRCSTPTSPTCATPTSSPLFERLGSRAAAPARRRSWPARRPQPDPVRPDRALPGRPAEGARPRADGPAGLRFRGRPARREHASVLRRHARRHPHHHPLPRGRAGLRADGRPARDRPRALRGGPARAGGAASRSARPARHGRAREPVAADGDAGLPLAGVRAASSPASCAAAFGDDPAFAPDNLVRLYTRVERGFIRVDADEVDLSAARHPAPPPRAPADRRRPRRRGPARRLERGHARAARHRPARRPPGLPAGHPLAGRRLRLLPLLHAGRHARGPALPRRRRPQVPGLLDAIGQGDFAPLLGWLRENVHGQGAMPRLRGAGREASGGPLAVEPFLAHLRERYLGVR